jgi:hypothetical protein
MTDILFLELLPQGIKAGKVLFSTDLICAKEMPKMEAQKYIIQTKQITLGFNSEVVHFSGTRNFLLTMRFS